MNSNQRDPIMFKEFFNQTRIERCVEIANSIFRKQKPGKPLRYKVEATEPIHGLPLQELAGKYFRVGYGGDQVTELPFIDMLVTLAYLKAIHLEYIQLCKTGLRNTEPQPVVTGFSAEEATQILTEFCIRTPFDPTDHLQIGIQREPEADA